MKKHKIILSILMLAIFLTYFPLITAKAYTTKINTATNNKYAILVDLTELRLYLIDNNTHAIVKEYPVAGGKESTPSPIGTWAIINKESGWGKGFGTRWMQLGVPWGKYGIHGTNKPLTIGGAESLGCIRMFNEDVENLYKYVDCGTTVVIYGGPYGLYWNKFRTLLPGDTGGDVYEVQRRLMHRGYYTGTLDGIYGEGMKSCIIKFRKDNKLSITHDIDKEFYNAIGMKPFE